MTQPEFFSVGEIAIAQHCRNTVNNGKEVVILAMPRPADWITPENTIVWAGHYWVKGPISNAQLLPFRLRKKFEPIAWTQCAWQPAKRTA